jgi:2-C-methyl-D-erythritol 4-phosphate cytidylyltransferase
MIHCAGRTAFVAIVEGEERNMKITMPFDLLIAEKIVEK